MKNQTTLIVGANSAIAKSLATETAKASNTELIVVSRDTEYYRQAMFTDSHILTVDDYHEVTIKALIEKLCATDLPPVSNVFICHGLLHTDSISPEKRIQEFSESAFLTVLQANTVTPMLWLQHLIPLIAGKQICKVVVFSARVGSISDNSLGGWYSYRASKAAMNMLLKTSAIEFSRSNKNLKLISFHPGTTDTPLSKPFQKNVPEGKLFPPLFVAQQLLKIVNNTEVDGKASYLDWKGKDIPW